MNEHSKDTLKICFQTVDQLVEYEKLKTGCLAIDKILKGGFRTNILNEIVGQSGSGKTQICLVLSLMVQLPKELGGLNKIAAYICTEGAFPIRRLQQLNKHFQEKYGNSRNFLDNVFIYQAFDYDGLRKTLSTNICEHLANYKSVGLIVIDSITSIFRSDNLEISYVERSKQFNSLSLILRKLGEKLNCVIMCINQVADNTFTGKTQPCQGLSWSTLINSRYEIKREDYSSSARKFRVEFATDLPNVETHFTISESGLS